MTEPCATPKRRGGKGKGRAKDKQGGPMAKKRRLTLNKDEKARVLLSICDVKVENVVLHVDETISSARHVLAWDQLGLQLLALPLVVLLLFLVHRDRFSFFFLAPFH